MTALPTDLLDIIVCPACHAQLALDVEKEELVCTDGKCGLAYPIKDGIPVLIVDQAHQT
ncbi:MAG: Trm112 family protein [Propionibacteriaceae bacterium]|jgi:uncharacterized protein YbaR (Trm112 family)|nr:Trm112 family protein [Propionibacteriaceae bacterium]